jgi:hypothetical protein
MRMPLFLLAVGLTLTSRAQMGDFEHLPLPTADTYYVNYSMPGQDVGFTDALVHYPCVYDTANSSTWMSGFVYSNMTDSVTPGFINRHSARPGSGSNHSQQYVVAYGQQNYIKRFRGYPGLVSFDVTNSTYAYNSMRYGDSLAKKFGGPSGNDSDWFKLTLRSYQEGKTIPDDSLEVFLADFRSPDSSKDYILKDWKSVGNIMFTEHGFAYADSVTFTLTSSDTGRFGINTPLYFCLDNIRYYEEGVQAVPFAQAASISPNPATDFIQLSLKDPSIKGAIISDFCGRQLGRFQLRGLITTIDIASLPPGPYLLQLSGDEIAAATTFIRR